MFAVLPDRKGRLTRAVLSTGGRGLLVNDEPPRGGGASHPAVSRGTEMRSEVCSHLVLRYLRIKYALLLVIIAIGTNKCCCPAQESM